MISSREERQCIGVLKTTRMFRQCSQESLQYLAKKMVYEKHKKGTVLFHQGEKQDSMVIIKSGEVQRIKVIRGQIHKCETVYAGMSVGSNHVLHMDPNASTCRCTTDVEVYRLRSDDFVEALQQPHMSIEIVYGLNRELRRHKSMLQTPLLEQHPKPTPYFSISIAAGIESFYRSALNATLNAKLTGQPPASLFPNMGVQVPVRIFYINGFKGIRQVLDRYIDRESYENTTAIRLGAALIPGVIMTPISSILEACNAGHMNSEALTTRWIRGLVPRGFREVIFGIGLNQLSDYCEERLPMDLSPAMKNAGGSLIAGVIAGYFSHVPHNLSTLKLMNPQKSYYQHIHDLSKASERRLPTYLSSSTRRFTATAMALFLPRGLFIRTTQITGSFIILNGTINSLKDINFRQRFNYSEGKSTDFESS